ncbi:MAG: hypothetical protein WBN56_03570 [Robiginitalea sp.]|uniref:hypothetical protein n=1 Tax=Robiginitalea sp. TaxID=1902411 RepID=UPI003C747F31
MRTFIYIFSFFFFVSMQAQQRTPQLKVEVKTMELVPVWKIIVKSDLESSQMVRLYRRQNTRVKRELSFTTYRSRPAMA